MEKLKEENDKKEKSPFSFKSAALPKFWEALKEYSEELKAQPKEKRPSEGVFIVLIDGEGLNDNLLGSPNGAQLMHLARILRRKTGELDEVVDNGLKELRENGNQD